MEIKNKYNINPILFEVTNEKDEPFFKIYYKNYLPADIKIQSILYFPEKTRDLISHSKNNYIYLTLFSTDKVTPQLLYQKIKFSASQLSEDGLLKFEFNTSFPATSKLHMFKTGMRRIRLSYSNREWDDQDLEDGAFIDTYIPYEVILDER